MKLKNLFFKEKTEEVTPQAKKTETPVFIMPTTNSGEFIDHFDKLMEKSNQAGLDFFEFTKGLDSIAAAPMSEQQKYETIFATFKASGLTISKLVETGQGYIQLMDKELESFLKALAASKDQKIEAPKALIMDLNKQNEGFKKSIQANELKINELTQGITENTITLAGKESSFKSSYNNSVQRVKETLQKIKTYLNDTNA